MPLFVQWADKAAYQKTLEKLGGLFQRNFETYTVFQMGGKTVHIPEAILAAGPVVKAPVS